MCDKILENGDSHIKMKRLSALPGMGQKEETTVLDENGNSHSLDCSGAFVGV